MARSGLGSCDSLQTSQFKVSTRATTTKQARVIISGDFLAIYPNMDRCFNCSTVHTCLHLLSHIHSSFLSIIGAVSKLFKLSRAFPFILFNLFHHGLHPVQRVTLFLPFTHSIASLSRSSASSNADTRATLRRLTRSLKLFVSLKVLGKEDLD